jgi:hypothetical protein
MRASRSISATSSASFERRYLMNYRRTNEEFRTKGATFIEEPATGRMAWRPCSATIPGTGSA